jgi:tetratricopeptide (TPR) repeat protein
VKYCHNCGYKLTLGTEKFCPDCGQNLTQQSSDYDKKVSIHETTGDVIGTGVSGSGHFIGKEIGYTVQGNVINLHISGGVSNEVLQTLQKMTTVPTQVDSTLSVGGREYNNKEVKEKQEAVVETKQQISQVLEDVNKISRREGKEIQEIKAGDLHISTKELSVNEINLKGNEHYYKREYSEAIKWYDKSIELDPNNVIAWYNKGSVLDSLGKHEEAIEHYDKAIEINPNYADVWNNKGLALYHLGKYKEAIKYYDKAIEIDPNMKLTQENRDLAYKQLGNPTNSTGYEKTEKSRWKRLFGK